ncbi:MAG TPA: hypothetical protein VLH61_07285 [Bacteroidales bacterium]|nr:hypothetical protein [Bacteroidales bacterium]
MADIELVDIMLKMSMNFNKKDFLNIPYDFRQNLLPEELLDCYLIAEQTSSVSRFANEPKIGQEKTKKLYRKWVDNVVNKTFADGLFLEKDNNSVQGIHIIKTDFIKKIGCFSLTGVRSDLKGLGIGKRLWLQSFAYWANETETNKIMTSFSFKNAESFNFHLKMGFNKTDEVKYIYHFRNHNKL